MMYTKIYFTTIKSQLIFNIETQHAMITMTTQGTSLVIDLLHRTAHL